MQDVGNWIFRLLLAIIVIHATNALVVATLTPMKLRFETQDLAPFLVETDGRYFLSFAP